MARMSSEKIGWRLSLLGRKVRGQLPGIGWPYLLHRLSPTSWRCRAEIRGDLRCKPAGDRFEEFDTPWGSFRVPAPGQEALTGMLNATFVNAAYENSRVSVRKGDIVIDCGANVGVFARFALRRGAALVICVEMDDANFSCLRENVRSEKDRIITLKTGLWSRSTALSFQPGSHPLFHRLQEVNPSSGTRQATTLDSVVSKQGLARVDYIKVVVNGAEADVLEGALDTLRRCRPNLALGMYDDPMIEEKVRALFSRSALAYDLSYGFLNPVDPKVLFASPAGTGRSASACM